MPQKFKSPESTVFLSSSKIPYNSLSYKISAFYPSYYSIVPLLSNFSSTPLWFYTVLKEKEAYLHHSLSLQMNPSIIIHPLFFLISTEFHSFLIDWHFGKFSYLQICSSTWVQVQGVYFDAFQNSILKRFILDWQECYLETAFRKLYMQC